MTVIDTTSRDLGTVRPSINGEWTVSTTLGTQEHGGFGEFAAVRLIQRTTWDNGAAAHSFGVHPLR